jgi:starch phosphorylase
MDQASPAPSPLNDGRADVAAAADALAERLPARLAPFARIAYNYLWSWDPDAEDLFQAIDPQRWELCNGNPIRLLTETSSKALQRAVGDDLLIGRAEAMLGRLTAELARPPMASRASERHPVAFLCAEFGIHRSLPIYAGGLGVLAGDILKEASDLALPMVGVGLLYREGYFLQRTDASGYQHEYWRPVDPERLPAALVLGQDGNPLTVPVPLRGREVVVQVWRVEVGRTPLYLLDAERPENGRVDRWITGRLGDSSRPVRAARDRLGAGSAGDGDRPLHRPPQRGTWRAGPPGAGPYRDARRARPLDRLRAGSREDGLHHPYPGGSGQRGVRRLRGPIRPR